MCVRRRRNRKTLSFLLYHHERLAHEGTSVLSQNNLGETDKTKQDQIKDDQIIIQIKARNLYIWLQDIGKEIVLSH